jgi:hypothetical protein
MRGANPRTSLSVSWLFCRDARARYGFFVALAFGGGGGAVFVFVFAGGFALVFVLAGATFAGLDVFTGGVVFAGLFMFSLVAVLQPAARAPRARVANSAAIFDLVMKPPLVVSGYRALKRKSLLDDFVKLLKCLPKIAGP